MIRSLPENTNDLEEKHKLHVYEGIGYMISMENDTLKQEVLLKNLMKWVDADWKKIIDLASSDEAVLLNDQVIREISFIIRVNERVAFGVGNSFYLYIYSIFS